MPMMCWRNGVFLSWKNDDLFSDAENAEARLTKDEKGPGGFQLFIDQIPILRWFRQKAKEFLEHIGIKIKDREQGRGMGMR